MSDQLRKFQIAMKNTAKGLHPDLSFLNRQDRFFAYTEGYPVRLGEGLAENYEASYKLLGHHVFSELSFDFIRQRPSTHYNVNAYHQDFANFAASHPSTQVFPFMKDLLAYDWAFTQTFHTAIEPPLAKEVLEKIPPENWGQLRFEFQPYLRVMSSGWPIGALWDQCMKDDFEFLTPVVPKQTYFILFRQHDDVYRQVLAVEEFTALSYLMARYSLGETCGYLAEHFEDIPIARWMQTWMENTWLIG